jgi:hypothetical protein
MNKQYQMKYSNEGLLKMYSLVLGFATTYAQTFGPNNGLVVHFPFNGNANDASGNGKKHFQNLIMINRNVIL